MNRALLVATFLTCSLLAQSAAARTVVFTNLAAAPPLYDCCFGLIVGDFSGDEFDLAVSFTPSVSATLDSLDLGIGFNRGTNAVDVWLIEDSGGTPGSILESYVGQPPSGSSDSALLTLSSALHPLLVAGTQYWVAVSAQQLPSSFAWKDNITGDDGVASRTNGGSWQVFAGETASALRVNATPIAVAEPTSLLLWGTAVAVTALRRFRRGTGSPVVKSEVRRPQCDVRSAKVAPAFEALRQQ